MFAAKRSIFLPLPKIDVSKNRKVKVGYSIMQPLSVETLVYSVLDLIFCSLLWFGLVVLWTGVYEQGKCWFVKTFPDLSSSTWEQAWGEMIQSFCRPSEKWTEWIISMITVNEPPRETHHLPFQKELSSFDGGGRRVSFMEHSDRSVRQTMFVYDAKSETKNMSKVSTINSETPTQDLLEKRNVISKKTPRVRVVQKALFSSSHEFDENKTQVIRPRTEPSIAMKAAQSPIPMELTPTASQLKQKSNSYYTPSLFSPLRNPFRQISSNRK